MQLHDALAADVSSDTMSLPFGLPIDGATNKIQLLTWGDDSPEFKTALTLAASSTQTTYTASAVKFVAKARWL